MGRLRPFAVGQSSLSTCTPLTRMRLCQRSSVLPMPLQRCGRTTFLVAFPRTERILYTLYFSVLLGCFVRHIVGQLLARPAHAFSVLPQRISPPTTQRHKTIQMDSFSNAQLRVLVVDDNIDAAETLVWLFAAVDIAAVPAFNGTDALEKADELLPQFIFVDLEMPEMSGYEVVKHLRKRQEFSSITIVALTARDDTDTRTKVLTSGFNKHVVKPAHFDTLRGILAGVAIP